MQLRIVLILLSLFAACRMVAGSDYEALKPMRVVVPEWTPRLAALPATSEAAATVFDQTAATGLSIKPDLDFFKQKTNPGVKPYQVMDELTFVGVPLFAAGILIKSEKHVFRQDYRDKLHPNTRFLSTFSTPIDDYTQYFGPAMTVGLKLGGVEGRSDWPRLAASMGMSYLLTAAIVGGIKYTSKEIRPDGSTYNSWPSGHTATSFAGATILHKEYGLTRSPWYSVAGYGVATATGIMRVLNNRHWVSDIFSGAGIGIMSTELGYALSDVLFKGKGLLRNELPDEDASPSMLSISMGFGLGTHDMTFTPADLMPSVSGRQLGERLNIGVDFDAATTVDCEGAYFFNKYVGIGGRLRVRAMTAKGWSDIAEQTQANRLNLVETLKGYYAQSNPGITAQELTAKENAMREVIMGNQKMIAEESAIFKSNHLTEFSGTAGLYFNLPLGERFALGTKLLVGRSMTQELAVDMEYKGNVKEMDYLIEIENGQVKKFDVTRFVSTAEDYETTFTLLTLGGNNTATYGTGLSLTYRYKHHFLWKAFVDYDYSKKDFTLTYNPHQFLASASPSMAQMLTSLGASLEPMKYVIGKRVSHVTMGGSFAINF